MNLFKGCGYQDDAKVVDGKLILSLPNAATPVVWQMDLAQAKASALEVNDNKKGNFALVMKTPKGETIEIAPFENKEQAVKSLMAASKALSRAHGQIHVASAPAAAHAAGSTAQPVIINTHAKSSWLKKIALLAIGLGIIFVMLNILSSMAPRAPAGMEPMGLSNLASQQQAPAAADQTGVPVSADEYLKRN